MQLYAHATTEPGQEPLRAEPAACTTRLSEHHSERQSSASQQDTIDTVSMLRLRSGLSAFHVLALVNRRCARCLQLTSCATWETRRTRSEHGPVFQRFTSFRCIPRYDAGVALVELARIMILAQTLEEVLVEVLDWRFRRVGVRFVCQWTAGVLRAGQGQERLSLEQASERTVPMRSNWEVYRI